MMKIDMDRARHLYSLHSRFGVYTHSVKECVFQYTSRTYGEQGASIDALRGLIWLLEHTGNQVGPNREINQMVGTGRSLRIEDVKRAFSSYCDEVLEERRSDYEFDKEDFVSYYKATPDELGHPWGDEEVAVMKAWLALDPFEWFLVSHFAKEAGIEMLGDFMDHFMTTEPEAQDSIHEAVFNETERLMTEFAKRVQCENVEQEIAS